MLFIAELGSGNTCRNDRGEVRRLIDGVAEVDSCEHDVVFKWQLWDKRTKLAPNIRLSWDVFEFAYNYAAEAGYKTTASVFDRDALAFLLEYRVPFVKIANRSHLYGLIDECPVPMYVSVSHPAITFENPLATTLANVAKYPAGLDEYESVFPDDLSRVSDHTVGWELYRKHRPRILEKHVVHERRATNPDAGPFAVTIDELAEVL